MYMTNSYEDDKPLDYGIIECAGTSEEKTMKLMKKCEGQGFIYTKRFYYKLKNMKIIEVNIKGLKIFILNY